MRFRKSRVWVPWFLYFFLVFSSALFAQPANDLCSAASIINLGAGNFGTGLFTSASFDLTSATKDVGEPFHSTLISAGNDKKSMWFKFTLPTARGIKVELKQPGNAIATADAGFTVYLSSTCNPPLSAITPAKLTPINKFGSTFNPCLVPGDYLIQVSSKAAANGPVFLEVTSSLPGVTNDYDFPASAQNIGTLSTSGTGWLSFDVGCQTIENATETCPALTGSANYTQSTWHVFRTPANIDFLRMMLRRSGSGSFTCGYSLYQGDIRTAPGPNPWTSLTNIDGCKSITGGTSTQDYYCNLLPNTYYSIQIFHHKDSMYTFQLNLDMVGAGQTQSPLTAAAPYMNPTMQMGTLAGSPGGSVYSRSDIWACNAKMNTNPCPTVKPAAGYSYGGNTYDLNDWVTFTTTTSNNLQITTNSGCMPMYVRIYSGDVNAGCGLTLYGDFLDDRTYNCLPAGTYSIQLLGRAGLSNPFDCNTSHLSQNLNVQLRLTSVQASNTFNFTNTGAALEKIYSLNPLPDGIQIYSASDIFGCNNTILPADFCAGTTKGIYRIVNIGDSDGDGFADSGFLTVGGKSNNFSYRIYRGDIRSASSGGVSGTFPIAPMVNLSGCVGQWPDYETCVTPGIYTIITFGDGNDVGNTDQIWVKFTKIQSQFNLSASGRINKINFSGGALQNLVTNTTYNTTLDRFDCAQTVLPAGTLCGSGTDRAIYRVFKIGQKGIVNISGNCYRDYKLYLGDASTYAGPYTYPNTIATLSAVSGCFNCSSGNICLNPGTYTLVAFGNSSSPNQTDQPSIYYKALVSQFNLANNTRYNRINNMNPLISGNNYVSTADVFDCDPTVLPAGSLCGSGSDRMIYREFVVSTPGILLVYGTCGNNYRLYSGDASVLASSFTYPNTISGLTAVTNCFYGSCYGGTSTQICITPGTYTLVTFGNANSPNTYDQPSITFTTSTTSFDDPTAGRVNNMGTISATTSGTVDYFSCLNNPRTIDGINPCNGATKQIYRQFQLSQPMYVSISGNVGIHTLFTGWASDAGGWANLSVYAPAGGSDAIYGARDWTCFYSQSTTPCMKLPAGKYTVVSYGSDANLSQSDNITITKLADPTPQSYPNPGLAFNGGNVSWNTGADGVAYPMTKQTYTFGTEHFNCQRNLPGVVSGCAPLAPGPANANPPHQGTAFNRATFYVFNVTQVSYLRIQDIPSSMRVQVYPLDCRTSDSTLFGSTTPIQDCITRQDVYMGIYCMPLIGEIEICKMQPRVYTMVIYATDDHVWQSVTPRLTLEKVEVSRFDHASTAYDFGAVPGDNTLRFGKVGDTNPINAGRAASNDFFTCTTGARRLDPGRTAYYTAGARILDAFGACWAGQYPAFPPVQADSSSVPYPMNNNYAMFYDPTATDTTLPPIRRNLWYTFTIAGGGNVSVQVLNKTATENNQVPFSVYKSDVNGALSYVSIAGTANNDSTLGMGLTFVGNNIAPYYYCCTNQNTISFSRDACVNTTDRYYIVVDHNIYNELNNQVEVGVKFQSIASTGSDYDFYSWANQIMNAAGQPANGPLGTIPLSYGRYKGARANFLCRTHSAASDQSACSPRSIWYVVDVGVEGRMRINYGYPTGFGTDTTYNANEMVLYRQTGSDSTFANMSKLSPNFIWSGGRSWGEVCVTPGRYYIMMTGCSYNNDTIQPQVWLLGRPVTHDFYSHAGANIGGGILTNGTYSGDTATFACATRSTPDPTNSMPCAERTLWYKFQVGTTGKVRIRYNIIGAGFTFDENNAKLYFNTVAGDSTGPELIEQSLNTITSGGNYWGETCMRPGTYYILLTGCWYTTEDVYPQIQLIEEPGDYCTNPINISLSGAGSANGSAVVDCHTIGEAFGEDGSNMGCLFGPAGYKSTWFKVSYNSALKHDMTFQLSEATTALPNQIRYRVMYGTCGAMTAGPCNTDALTQFTLNCMSTGDYYIQVLTPDGSTGNLSFTVTTTLSPDQSCIPLDPSKPIANFTIASACETDSVHFDNQSSQGSDITYFWDFGVTSLTNDTSHLKSPAYLYPLTGTVATYNVKLVVTNTSNGQKDSVITAVTVYPKPGASITHLPAVITGGNPTDFFANPTNTIATPPTTYLWDFGTGIPSSSTAQNPTGIIFNNLGTNVVSVTVFNGLCAYTDYDTFVVGTEPIYVGGPYDGSSMGTLDACPIEQVWTGGPYDGHASGDLISPCMLEQIWTGGPYDGHASNDLASPCINEQIWTGGPYDGHASGDLASPCVNEQIWTGGPFDGHDMADLNINVTSSTGSSQTICAGTPVTLTASYTGPGTPTFTYQWYANNGILAGQTANILNVTPATTTTYRVNMFTTAGSCFDSLEQEFSVIVQPGVIANAGPDVSTCGAGVQIGTAAQPGATYSWSPTTGLSDPNIAQPIANPSSTTTYTLTVTVASCPNSTDAVIVTVDNPPTISAGPDTAACFPGSVNLTGSGADIYIWQTGLTALANNALVSALPNPNFTGSSTIGGAYVYSAAKSAGSGWRPSTNNTAQYIQVDLGASKAIHSVATIGSNPNFVTSYQISYTDETVPSTWVYYQEGGVVRTFVGNVDAFTTVTRTLANYIRARHIRFHPVTWSTGIGMRVEVYTDNARLSLNNPFAATAIGSYVLHGRSNVCPDTYKDTTVVNNKALEKLMFRSRQNGNWTALTTWQVYQNGSWVNAELITCPAAHYPTSADSTVWVRDSVYYDFTIPAGIDEVTIDPVSVHNAVYGGIIHIPTGITLNMVDGTNSGEPADIQNFGVINIIGNFTPVGAGLLVNDDQSTVRYLAAGNQTMWNGQYGKLVAGIGGSKIVGGTTTLVRTNVRFQNAWIELNNRSITLDTACTVSDASLAVGYFVTNGLGSVRKVKLDSGTPFEYPIGPNTTSFNRAIFANNGVSDTYSLRVAGSFDFDPNFPSDELVLNTSVNRSWYMSEITPGGSNIALTLHWYAAHENISFDRTNCSLGEYRTATGWARLGSQSPAAGGPEYYQTYNGITNPQIYSIGSCALTPMDYRTIANGNWTDINIWEVLNPLDGNWYAANLINTSCGAVSYPTSASRTVLVRHNVTYDYTIPAGIDQVTITPVARITIPNGINLILNDGPGSDFIYPATSTNGLDIDNQGYLEITGDFSLASGSPLLLNNPGSWVEYNGGNQNMWNGAYANLKLTGSMPNAGHLKSLTGSLTAVNQTLVFNNAKMQLGVFNCLMGASAYVSGASQTMGYMIATNTGYCSWDYVAGVDVSHTFPVGGVYYSPAVIKFDNVATGGTLLGRVKETVHPLRPYSIKRYWTIIKGTVSFTGSYTAALTYDDMDLPSIPTNLPEEETMVQIAGIYNPLYVQPGGWRVSPLHIPYTQFLTTNTGVVINDAFSDFTFFPSEVPLPVSNVLLEAQWQNREAKLNWRTPLESEISHYEIERSLDGDTFENIHIMPAEKNNGLSAAYQWLDSETATKPENKFYYRVKQVDFNGNFVFSNIVELSRNTSISMFTVYPNPLKANTSLFVRYSLSKDSPAKIELYENTGRLVLKQSENLLQSGQFEIPVGEVTSGVYYLKINTLDGNTAVKLLIEK